MSFLIALLLKRAYTRKVYRREVKTEAGLEDLDELKTIIVERAEIRLDREIAPPYGSTS